MVARESISIQNGEGNIGYDAQLNNTSERNVRQYVDLDLFFSKRN